MIRVYCDFDGTVCTTDVGEHFFRHFLGKNVEPLVEQFLQNKISGKELLERECTLLPPLEQHDVTRFAEQFSLDPFFPTFVEFCREREIPIVILSDGLDVYITALLERAGLGNIPVFANRALFIRENGNSRLHVEFPYTDEECRECGNCKRNHILTRSADEDYLVYVGDGYSDRCPVEYVDFVFAKRHLIPFCQQKNITYFEFRDFSDVQRKLEQLIQRKRLRHRVEAARARMRVFMQG